MTTYCEGYSTEHLSRTWVCSAHAGTNLRRISDFLKLWAATITMNVAVGVAVLVAADIDFAH